jgi:AcrR family transcriptional regulator
MPSPPPTPSTGRRPQAERSLASRTRILDAAVTCLLEAGYARTNTLSVQARAGVSRGRLLHHFRSKEDLLVAAAKHVCAVRLVELQSLTPPPARDAGPAPGGDRDADPPRDPAAGWDAAVDLLWRSFHQPHFWAMTELRVAARTEPTLAEVLRPAERRLARAVRSAADGLFGPPATAHPRYPALRRTLVASMHGVALGYAVEPRDVAAEPALAEWRRLTRTVLLDPLDDGPRGATTTERTPVCEGGNRPAASATDPDHLEEEDQA